MKQKKERKAKLDKLRFYLIGICCKCMWPPPFRHDGTHAKMLFDYSSSAARRISDERVKEKRKK